MSTAGDIIIYIERMTMAEVTAQLDTADDVAHFAEMGVLGRLLKERSTDRNIIWVSSVFMDKGGLYASSDELSVAYCGRSLADNGRPRSSAAELRETNRPRSTTAKLEVWDRYVVYPLVRERESIDLDDGVKVNYNNFPQTSLRCRG